ncbi:CBS domain-containing protein [Falsibacillus albus]|uniref:CBS domain-containing protein n=1 Tax=Falsibacillus albus TaxID=2478915 RepID=A0A3L7K5L4_9BACI|nr:CBS domain-containing protein [Falsibacillus albus]RLQ97361.1 CBS domain-containing protein [Falsibacillus albus]
MQVRDVMSTNVQSCSNQDSLQDVANKMHSSNIGAIPVVQNGQVVGMVTDRDLAIRGVTDGNAHSSVSQIMSNNIVTVQSDASLEEAAALMSQHQIRRLPVVDNGQIVGMLSLGDLAVRDQSNNSAGGALSQISKNNDLQ